MGLECQYGLPHWRPSQLVVEPGGRLHGSCPWCGAPVVWNAYPRRWLATARPQPPPITPPQP